MVYPTNLVVDKRGSFADVFLTQMGPSFVDYVLSIGNGDLAVRVIEPHGDDLAGATEPPCPVPSPPSQHPSSTCTFMDGGECLGHPHSLKGNDASSE